MTDAFLRWLINDTCFCKWRFTFIFILRTVEAGCFANDNCWCFFCNLVCCLSSSSSYKRQRQSFLTKTWNIHSTVIRIIGNIIVLVVIPGDSIRQSDPIGIWRDFLKILSDAGLWTDSRIPSVGIRLDSLSDSLTWDHHLRIWPHFPTTSTAKMILHLNHTVREVNQFLIFSINNSVSLPLRIFHMIENSFQIWSILITISNDIAESNEVLLKS